ncbi:IclR family transcriptional regulator [Hyphomicrobiales bacterium]|nr:IclR family transcriptional regulator [Hyphomicrobiales bacterium]
MSQATGTEGSASLQSGKAGEPSTVEGDAATTESPLFNNSVEKAFAVLRSFGQKYRSMTLSQIAEAAGINKSSAQRSSYTLEVLGYLCKEPQTRRYMLTPKVLELGFCYIHSDPLLDHANPYLAELNIRCKETVNLWRPDGSDMICIARFPGHLQVTSHMPLGKRLPMYCASSGRAYLSGRPSDEVQRILSLTNFLAYTPNTIVSRDAIAKKIDDGRAAGYCWAYDEYYRGDIAIAAPVLGAEGYAIAAVNISVPITRWTVDDAIAHFSPHVLEVARSISRVPEPGVLAAD